MPKLKKLPLFFSLFSIFPTIANSFTLLDAWQAALGYSADFSAAKHERDAESEKKNRHGPSCCLKSMPTPLTKNSLILFPPTPKAAAGMYRRRRSYSTEACLPNISRVKLMRKWQMHVYTAAKTN